MPEKRLIDATAFDRDLETMESNLRGVPSRWKDRVEVVRMVRKMLSAAPTIGPEMLRPVAHWEGQYDGYFDGEPVYDVWECSSCGHIIDDGTDCEDDLPHYCPTCGAKMENNND